MADFGEVVRRKGFEEHLREQVAHNITFRVNAVDTEEEAKEVATELFERESSTNDIYLLHDTVDVYPIMAWVDGEVDPVTVGWEIEAGGTYIPLWDFSDYVD